MSDYVRPPADVVRPALTRAALVKLNHPRRSVVTLSIPGEVTEDTAGVPDGIDPPRTFSAPLAGVIISRGEADALGIDPVEFPHIRIIDPREDTP